MNRCIRLCYIAVFLYHLHCLSFEIRYNCSVALKVVPLLIILEILLSIHPFSYTLIVSSSTTGKFGLCTFQCYLYINYGIYVFIYKLGLMLWLLQIYFEIIFTSAFFCLICHSLFIIVRQKWSEILYVCIRYIIAPQCNCLLSSEVVFVLSIFFTQQF